MFGLIRSTLGARLGLLPELKLLRRHSVSHTSASGRHVELGPSHPLLRSRLSPLQAASIATTGITEPASAHKAVMGSSARAPVLFLAHGGGPMPLLGDPASAGLVRWLKAAAPAVRPKAILLFSAHWEEKHPTVLTAASPGLLYDYYGFPPEAYTIKYPAQNAPEVVQQVLELLRAAGFAPQENATRGYDHGVFVPLKLMYPAADIPVVQVSLLSSLDPKEHIRLGEAVAGLRDQGVFVVGSGFSFHNMSGFFSPDGKFRGASESFHTFLKATVAECTAAPEERKAALSRWASVPGARDCHPREEHLIPLMVCLGAARGKGGRVVYEELFMDRFRVMSFQFDD